MTEVVFELKQVTKRFKENIIFDGLDLKIRSNSVVGIIGKSGCGKSTLLNILVGFLSPNAGSVFFKGQDIQKQLKEVEKNCGFSSQESSFYKKLSISENLNYFGRLYGLENKVIVQRSEDLIKLFDLKGSEKAIGEQLSTGMQKRLDMMCALIHDPEVLILDEPTANLDPLLRKDILRFVKQIRSSGKTVILTSHILGEIDYLCDEIFILHNKRISKVGDSKERILVLETVSHKYDHLRKLLGKVPTKVHDGHLHIKTSKPEKVLATVLKYSLKSKDEIVAIRKSKSVLSSVFERTVGKR